MNATVIIPTFNQYCSLMIMLDHMKNQNIASNRYEVIVIDDGSTDETRFLRDDEFKCIYGSHFSIIHLSENSGRSKARNKGIELATNEIIIFCDSDRFPATSFVSQHISFHQSGSRIVVGASYDYFGKLNYLSPSCFDWDTVYKYSRLPNYYRRITKLFENGHTKSPAAWLSLLIGNASIRKELLITVGGFNPTFRYWGFEHFELGLRLKDIEPEFYNNPNAKNYHIPHARTQGFYQESIKKNIEILSVLYPDINYQLLMDILTTNLDITSCADILMKKQDN